MVGKTIENPFDELPEALVEEMLNQCDELGKNLSNSFQKLYDNKNEIKQELKRKKLLRKETEISFAPAYPTTCGVEWFICHRKITFYRYGCYRRAGCGRANTTIRKKTLA